MLRWFRIFAHGDNSEEFTTGARLTGIITTSIDGFAMCSKFTLSICWVFLLLRLLRLSPTAILPQRSMNGRQGLTVQGVGHACREVSKSVVDELGGRILEDALANLSGPTGGSDTTASGIVDK